VPALDARRRGRWPAGATDQLVVPAFGRLVLAQDVPELVEHDVLSVDHAGVGCEEDEVGVGEGEPHPARPELMIVRHEVQRPAPLLAQAVDEGSEAERAGHRQGLHRGRTATSHGPHVHGSASPCLLASPPATARRFVW
jgi:hypothetical protein